jgi:hypothetical protein
MKKEFAEFLLKRITTKAEYINDASSAEELTSIADDIIEYASTLKDIIKEVLLP